MPAKVAVGSEGNPVFCREIGLGDIGVYLRVVVVVSRRVGMRLVAVPPQVGRKCANSCKRPEYLCL